MKKIILLTISFFVSFSSHSLDLWEDERFKNDTEELVENLKNDAIRQAKEGVTSFFDDVKDASKNIRDKQ